MTEVIVDGVTYVPKKEPAAYKVTPPCCFEGRDATEVGDAIYDWLNYVVEYPVFEQVDWRFRGDC